MISSKFKIIALSIIAIMGGQIGFDVLLDIRRERIVNLIGEDLKMIKSEYEKSLRANTSATFDIAAFDERFKSDAKPEHIKIFTSAQSWESFVVYDSPNFDDTVKLSRDGYLSSSSKRTVDYTRVP